MYETHVTFELPISHCGEAWLSQCQSVAGFEHVAVLCLVHIALHSPFSLESLASGLADRLSKIADVPVSPDDGLSGGSPATRT